MNDVYALVRSLRERRFPRNRFFDAHATVSGAEARRVHRFLRGIERDLLTAQEVRVRIEGARWLVTMTFPSVRLHRVVSLTAAEHAILVEDPRVAALLSATG